FRAEDGQVFMTKSMPMADQAELTATGTSTPADGLVVYGFSDGRIGVAKPEYALSYPNDKRLVTPGLGYPLGEEPAVLDEQGDALRHVAIQQGPNAIYVAAVTEDKRLLQIGRASCREREEM